MASLKKTHRPIFIDIDGTLTDTHNKPWGNVFRNRIQRIQQLIGAGYQIVIWSGCGTNYVKEFAEKNGIEGAVCIGKPEYYIDDNPAIRPNMVYLKPEELG